MSLGIDTAECVSSLNGSTPVAAGGRPISCTTSDGASGSLAIVHLSLVDSTESAAFDYGQAFGFWGLAFTSVVALYFVCRGIGTVVDFIRRA
jgi:hypothetical protein